ncbi:MAG TPA: c-type cytochrome [Gemmataceae bacterium]|jgi:mono/diheme cytochrome c family protein
MAATDQTYRNQRTLDIVFAASCILMLLGTLWMFWQDYNREFKQVQREFRDVEEAMNEHQMIGQLPSTDQVAKARKKIAEAKNAYDAKHDEVLYKERELMAKHDLADNKYRSIKADFDSKMSLYNIAIEHANKESDPGRQKNLKEEVDALYKELFEKDTGLQTQLTKAQDELDKLDQQIRVEVTQKLDDPKRQVDQAEDDLKKLTAGFDRFAKVTAQKRWKFGDEFRRLPILDAFESPTKIKQLWLPDLTIDYGGFKDVPRYDRCISCHLGIDRGTFDHESVARLTRDPDTIKKEIAKAEQRKKDLQAKDAPEEEIKRADSRIAALGADLKRAEAMQARLTQAREMLIARQDAGEKLGFDPSDLPKQVRWLKLNKGEITQYAAHPRLDLFVEANSAHPMEKFGCTACHDGQGSATDFVLAAHTPADATQEEEWQKEHGWTHSHFWDFPMRSSRFIESSCLKCHHEVTDLSRRGSKQEAPKLLRGYELVRENGCFGCHEISGIKAGHEVGPDLRLEPQPALEYLTAAEQDKAKSDPLNLPGQYRKVGPSLRRIAEKTNEDWVRKWVQSPRGFRPDTKMPHFYGLSNNSPDNPDLPDDQKKFPAAEIAGIAHYLLAESKGNLDAKDTARKVLENTIDKQQGELQKGRLAEREWKALLDASRRLGDLGLMSVPSRANEINRALTRQKQLQERMQELQKRAQDLKAQKEPQELSDEEQTELQQAGKDLKEVTKQLIDACQIKPLAKEITDEEGKSVELPKAGDAAKGRQLFTEKGCLACHSHDGTTKAAAGAIAVQGEATFAPNLSRIAAKIAPAVGGEDAKRRWIVQWVMNPTVYHPRTRMPITHLSPQQAADIAEWLLSQKVTDWDEKGPEQPTKKDLVALARLYLAKAPGFTRVDVDAILPMTDGDLPGISDERRKGVPDDADEQKLVGGPVKEDDLKWYIGRKAINRLGCFGCHDLPGFESAKPIGTALNDWGKKDAERLAFEDGDIFVRDHYNPVKLRNDPDDPSKPAADWKDKDGKPPYEEIYVQAINNHRREGFLHQKLMEPRSYDYHRIRTWDDRLRMPQFKFARTKRREGESDEAYKARQDFDEAQAREAVMVFILGLVAEPMPLKYLNRPNPDRLAEIKGHQALEKFNCAGCHQIRPGVYEFKTTPDGLKELETTYNNNKGAFKGDHVFPGHDAWTGKPQTTPDRLTVVGTYPTIDDANYDPPMLTVRLTDALRFTGRDGLVRNLPAASIVPINPEDLTTRADPWGGTFTELMVQYLPKGYPGRYKADAPDMSRSVLPPPLVREGERVQPNWLYGFLLNPPPIRPESYMRLRMPKFNMSNEEARALANYFSGVSRLTNPGAGVSAEYVEVHQRDESYWRARTAEYVQRLKKEKKLEDKAKEMQPAWQEAMKRRIADAEPGLEAAKQAVKDAKKDDERKQRQKELDKLEAQIKAWKTELEKKDFPQMRKQWEQSGVYAADAYRLLTDRELCLKCHEVGNLKTDEPQGPNLDLTAQRLRPEWVRRWLANPDRLFAYKPNMPQNFANESLNYQNVFLGRPLEQATAVRDVLMDLPRVTEMPGIRSRGPAAAGGGK